MLDLGTSEVFPGAVSFLCMDSVPWDAALGSLTVPDNGSMNQSFLVNSQLNLLTNIQLQCGTSNLAEKERIQQWLFVIQRPTEIYQQIKGQKILPCFKR